MNNILSSEVIGEGGHLIVLHGLFGMKNNWKTFAKDISGNNFQVHLLDQRNHGDSFHSNIHTYTSMVEDLENYIETYNLKKIYLMGHSMGGKTAMKFACKNPKMVKKLIVADISPKYYTPHHKEILDALNSINLSKIKKRKEVQDLLYKQINNIGISMFLSKNIYTSNDELKWKFNLHSITKNIDVIGEGLNNNEIFDGESLFFKRRKFLVYKR